MKIKAISLKQPWANMVVSVQKTIETRKWKTKYRGPLLIVSSKKPPIEPAGYAVALVDLVECRPMTVSDEEGACIRLYPKANAWLLKNIQAIKPIPMKGSLGINEVEVEDGQIAPLHPGR